MTITLEQEQRLVEEKIVVLAQRNILSHLEVKHLLSYLQIDIVDLNSKERAVAKELLSFRCSENIFAHGLIESHPMDCFTHHTPNAENKNRKHHGGYRKPFQLGESFSIDVIGSKNTEYPIRLMLVYNFDKKIWNQSTAVICLYEYKIGNEKLENIKSFSDISEDVKNALQICESIMTEYKNKTFLFTKKSFTRNFRKWNREVIFS